MRGGDLTSILDLSPSDLERLLEVALGMKHSPADQVVLDGRFLSGERLPVQHRPPVFDGGGALPGRVDDCQDIVQVDGC